MTPIDRLIHQIKQDDDYWSGTKISQQRVTTLANLTSNDYAEVVRRLLEEPPRRKTGLKVCAYRETYAHLVYGCILSIVRPNPSLYPIVLAGALGIGDPTSIQYGAFALRQIKPIEQIVTDLQEIVSEEQNDKELLSHVAWLLYWLGFSNGGHWGVPKSFISIDRNLAPLLMETTLPETNEQEAAKMTEWASEIMRLHYAGT